MCDEYYFDYGDDSYHDCYNETYLICPGSVDQCAQNGVKDKYKFYKYDALYNHCMELGNTIKLETGLPLGSALRLVAGYSLDTQKAICEWNTDIDRVSKHMRITDFSTCPNEPPEKEMVKVDGGLRESALVKHGYECNTCSTDSEPGSMFSPCNGRHVFCGECWILLITSIIDDYEPERTVIFRCPFDTVSCPCVYPSTLAIFDPTVPVPSIKASADEKIEALARRGAPFSFNLTSFVVKSKERLSWALRDLENLRVQREKPEASMSSVNNIEPINRFVLCNEQCGMFIVDSATIEIDRVGNASEISSYKKNQNMFAKCDECESCTCLRCLKCEHGPATCQNIRDWEEKNKNDKLTAEWITIHTKICPGCKKNIIEKNGGCNHMICSQCVHHFCWVCLDKFVDYNHICNVVRGYNTNNLLVNKLSYLGRYLHYFERYNNHRLSKSLDEKTMNRVIEYGKSTGSNYFEADKSYLKQVAKELAACRHTLAHSYVFAYYADPIKVNIGLFEHTQGELEHATEMLSAAVESEELERDKVIDRAYEATSILEVLRGADYSLII
eukprot:Tbor_TRINITY_DN4811_c0_g1::TRINITY_DN4811_c0_g1_i3::g.1230::m.1230/K11969/ARIH2; ariadne-2